MKNIKRGFTLIEMIAVLTILLVLAGIAVPTFQAVISEVRANAVELSAQALAGNVDAYAATQQVAPADLTAAQLATLVGEMPAGNLTIDTSVAGEIELTADAGTQNEKVATITLSALVGGSSSIA